MPANPKYLTKSNWQRFATISAAFLGGYMLTMTFHIALASWLHRPNMIITSTYSGFIVWSVLMILAFLSKNGWKIWGIYLLLTLLFCAATYFGKIVNPILS